MRCNWDTVNTVNSTAPSQVDLRRQHKPASRIAASSNWSAAFDVVEPRNTKFDAQSLTIKDKTRDGIGERFSHRLDQVIVSSFAALPHCMPQLSFPSLDLLI